MQRKPLHQMQQPRIEQEVVQRRKHAPEEREQRADDALNIAPAVGIVPQTDAHDMDAQQADQILDQRHDERHDEEHHEIIADAAGKAAENGVFDQRHTEQDDGADAVQRHARPEQKAGIQPLMLRVGAGKELAEQQLQHPSGAGAEEKQKYDIQKDLIF